MGLNSCGQNPPPNKVEDGEGLVATDVDIDSYPIPPDGSLLTDRNYPVDALYPYKIVPCRKADSIPINFYRELGSYTDSLKDPILKKIEDLNNDDKEYLCKLAWDTKEKKYFDLLVRLISVDTLKKDHDIRIRMVKSLSAFNNEDSKKVLMQMLNNSNKELSMISAIVLAQFGEYKKSLHFLSQNYQNEHYPVQVITAFMQINSAESVELLKKLAKEHPDPSIVIDALAALSLLGHCDYAFKGFSEYSKSKNENARKLAAICLAYYTGTPEAFKIIKGMQNDKDYQVQQEVKKIMGNYK